MRAAFPGRVSSSPIFRDGFWFVRLRLTLIRAATPMQRPLVCVSCFCEFVQHHVQPDGVGFNVGPKLRCWSCHGLQLHRRRGGNCPFPCFGVVRRPVARRRCRQPHRSISRKPKMVHSIVVAGDRVPHVFADLPPWILARGKHHSVGVVVHVHKELVKPFTGCRNKRAFALYNLNFRAFHPHRVAGSNIAPCAPKPTPAWIRVCRCIGALWIGSHCIGSPTM